MEEFDVVTFAPFVIFWAILVRIHQHRSSDLLWLIDRAHREVRLSRLALDLTPLAFLYGFFDTVGARARVVHLGDLPGLLLLRVRFSNTSG